MIDNLNIYLAGGMKSNWQKSVINALSEYEITFYNPDTSVKDPKIYVPNDIRAIDKCNILFGYYELTNPAGFAMCWEMGYAYAKHKEIILVDQVNNKYWDFIRESCDKVYDNLESGIVSLKKICHDYYN